MTLEEAIEINQSLLDATYDHWDEVMEEALKLGIEALKEQQRRHVNYPWTKIPLLPGETKD